MGMEYLGLSLASLGQSDRGAAPRTVPAGETAQDFAQAVELAAQPDAAPPPVPVPPNSAPTPANAAGVQPPATAPVAVVFDLAAQSTPLGDGALPPIARPDPGPILAAAPDPRVDLPLTGRIDPAAPQPDPGPVPEPQTLGLATGPSAEPRRSPAPDRATHDEAEPPAAPQPISTAPSIPQPLPTAAGVAAAPPPAVAQHPATGHLSLTGPAAGGRSSPAPVARSAPPVADGTITAPLSTATAPVPATQAPIFSHHVNAPRPAPRLSDLGWTPPTEPSQTGAQPGALQPVPSATPPQAGARADAQVPTPVLPPAPTQTGPQAHTDAPAPTQSPPTPAHSAPAQGQSPAIAVPVDLRAVAASSPVRAALAPRPVAAPGPTTPAEPVLATARIAPPDSPNGAIPKSVTATPDSPIIATSRPETTPAPVTGAPPRAATPGDPTLVGKPEVFSPPALAAGQAILRPAIAARTAPGRPGDAALADTSPLAPDSPTIARERVAPVGAATPPAPLPPAAGIAASDQVAKRAPDATKPAESIPLAVQPQLDALRKPGAAPASRMAPHDALIGADPSAPPPSGGPLPTAATSPAPTHQAPGTPEFARHVTGQIAHAVADAPGRDHVALRLDPPELGRIDIGMDLRDQTLRVTISTERASTGDLIRRHADQLISDFADAGFSGIDLSFAGQNQARRDGLAQPLPQLLAQTLPQPDQPIDPLIAASLDRRSPVAAADSGIDLRL